MKKPIINYKNLKLSNITSPEYNHILLLLGWVFYFVFFYLLYKLDFHALFYNKLNFQNKLV